MGALRMLSRAAASCSVAHTYVMFCDMVTVSHVTPQIVRSGSDSAMGSDVRFSVTLNTFFFFFFFEDVFDAPFFFPKSLLNSLQYCFCFYVWFSDHDACGILAPQQGMQPTPLHWKAKA